MEVEEEAMDLQIAVEKYRRPVLQHAGGEGIVGMVMRHVPIDTPRARLVGCNSMPGLLRFAVQQLNFILVGWPTD